MSVPAGAASRPDNERTSDTDSLDKEHGDDNEHAGCEKWKFLFDRDHAMLNVDVGLYLHFDTDANGYPANCTGLEGFNSSSVMPDSDLMDGVKIQGGDTAKRWAWQECGVETYAEPSTDPPLHEHMEEFARDQTAWLDAYAPAMEKYLANGYVAGELTPM